MFDKLFAKYKKTPPGVKAALWYTMCNLVQKGINIAVVPIYTRLLPQSEYGAYTVFMSWVELFEILVTFRLFFGTYVVGLVKFDKDREVFTSSLEQLSALITTVSFILYLVFSKQINSFTGMTTELTVIMFLMLYAIPVVGFWKALQRVDNHYVGMLIVTLTLSLMTPICGILSILFLRVSALSVIGSRVGIECLVALVLLWVYRSFYTRKPSAEYCKYALKMNIPLIPFYLSTVVLNHSDRIIIERLVDSSAAAIYSLAYSAAMILTLFNTAFDSALQPWLFKKLKSEDFGGITKVNTAAVLIVAGLNLALIALAPEALLILAPPQYHEAIWIIPPLAASVFVMFFYQRFINVEFYYHESKSTALASVGAALLNITLNFLLIPGFGYLAAGYTTLVSYLVFWITHYFCFRKVCKANNCPETIYDMKLLLLISAMFASVASVLMIGYEYAIIRYTFILLFAVTVIFFRKKLIGFAKRMLTKGR